MVLCACHTSVWAPNLIHLTCRPPFNVASVNPSGLFPKHSMPSLHEASVWNIWCFYLHTQHLLLLSLFPEDLPSLTWTWPDNGYQIFGQLSEFVLRKIFLTPPSWWGCSSVLLSDSSTVLINLGCYDKVPWTGQLSMVGIYFSQFWKLGSLRVRCWPIWCLVSSLFLVADCQLFLVSSHSRKQRG